MGFRDSSEEGVPVGAASFFILQARIIDYNGPVFLSGIPIFWLQDFQQKRGLPEMAPVVDSSKKGRARFKNECIQIGNEGQDHGSTPPSQSF